MLTLFIITSIISLLYLLYPVWLKSQPKFLIKEEMDGEMDGVSIIYLSQNSESTLNQKIGFLLNELNDFTNSELIVIDDGSEDKSIAVLKQFKDNRLYVISKNMRKGIAQSMNLGVKMSKFENIIFCDQRQYLSKGIIKKLITPLKYPEIGAVSSCISNCDKINRFSFLRAHENYIKKKEGKIGNLMGVYGPLYAVKKDCYKEIPDHIILDDLYLTLNILSLKNVVFLNDCQIFDDTLEILYSYKRAKRYLIGFLQILKEKDLLSRLSKKQIVMLLWHKYLRLSIPVLFLISYVMLGLGTLRNTHGLIIYSIFSILICLLIISSKTKNNTQIGSLFRLLSFYSIAFFELLILTIIYKKTNG